MGHPIRAILAQHTYNHYTLSCMKEHFDSTANKSEMQSRYINLIVPLIIDSQDKPELYKDFANGLLIELEHLNSQSEKSRYLGAVLNTLCHELLRLKPH